MRNRLILVGLCLVVVAAVAMYTVQQDADTETETNVENDAEQFPPGFAATEIVIPEGKDMEGCVVHMDRVECDDD